MLLLVSSTQNASVKGFQILDGILFFLIDKPKKALIEKRGLKRQPEAYREYTRDTKRQKTKRQTLTSCAQCRRLKNFHSLVPLLRIGKKNEYVHLHAEV